MKAQIRRDLLRHWRYYVLFVSLLALGLAGFLIVEALRHSVDRSLAQQSRHLLSADVSISVRRNFSADENALIQNAIKDLPHTRALDFFSMLGHDHGSQLILVRAIGADYPLAGEIRTATSPEPKLGTVLSRSPGGIAIARDSLDQFGLRLEDTVKLGAQQFRVIRQILDDPTQSFRNFALGGRAYIFEGDLAATQLIQAGSTRTESYFVLSPEPVALKTKLQTALPNPEISIQTAREAGESSTQSLAYLGDFLGLVSLIALLLTAIGSTYLFRHFMERRRHEIAILRALGQGTRELQLSFAGLATGLALIALIPAAVIASILLPVLHSVIQYFSQVDLHLSLSLQAFYPLLALCLFGTPLMLLAELLALKRFAPLELFRESVRGDLARPLIHSLPGLLFFIALAPIVSNSLPTSMIFLSALGGLTILLFVTFWTLSKFLKTPSSSWTTRHAVLFFKRRKRTAATVFLTLGLGSLLLNLLPQIEASLRAELEQPTHLPALFLFDIQEDQKDALKATLVEEGLDLTSISPLVRARLLKVNGLNFERLSDSSSFKTREEEQEARSRNRGINLSYREFLQDSESIVAGRPFEPRWDPKSGKLPEISVETRFAERMKLKLGDVLSFDIQGVEVEGRIVNERKVRWTSFQPNFFLLFQDGVLNDAPKTYLANLPALDAERKRVILARLSEKFPNVSVINVATVIEKILDLIRHMRLALLLLAGLGMAAGLSVLASVLSLEAMERSESLTLFRLLGAGASALRQILIKEVLIISSLAIATGAIGSVLISYVLSRYVFDGAFQVNYFSLVALSLILILIGILVTHLSGRRFTQQSPLELLRK